MRLFLPLISSEGVPFRSPKMSPDHSENSQILCSTSGGSSCANTQQKRIHRLEEEIENLRLHLLQKDRWEEKRVQAQKMESLETFAARISHDFNNILQSILGYTQLALFQMMGEGVTEESLKKIENAVHKGREFTERFLTFGRKNLPRFQNTDLNEEIVDMKDLLRRTIPAMIEIDYRLSPDLKKIRADKTHIQQIVMILSVNAKEAMIEGGGLVFETGNVRSQRDALLPDGHGESGEFVILSVADTGSGISPENLTRLYEPYFTTKEKGKRSGLGLAIVYSIVKNHGGWIDCSSRTGEGTTFRIYFPALSSEDSGQTDS